MLSTLSFKRKLSAVMLCLTVLCQQSNVSAWDKPSVPQQVAISAATLTAAHLLDNLLQRNAEQEGITAQNILSKLKQHLMDDLAACGIAPRVATETRLQHASRFLKEYCKRNPLFSIALVAVVVNAGHSTWTANQDAIADGWDSFTGMLPFIGTVNGKRTPAQRLAALKRAGRKDASVAATGSPTSPLATAAEAGAEAAMRAGSSVLKKALGKDGAVVVTTTLTAVTDSVAANASRRA